jgi:hypothetical protein
MAVIIVPDLKAPSAGIAHLAEGVLPDLRAVQMWLARRLPVTPQG